MNIREAYRLVMLDLASDVGYHPGVQKRTLNVLKGRLHEIETIHPWLDAVEALENDPEFQALIDGLELPDEPEEPEKIEWQSILTYEMVKHLPWDVKEELIESLNDVVVDICADYGIGETQEEE